MGPAARLHAIVRGRVQGIGYRWFVQEQAASRGLTGGVRNLRDGSVEVEAEGARADLEEFLERLREGPFGADVAAVDVSWFAPAGTYTDFEIWATK